MSDAQKAPDPVHTASRDQRDIQAAMEAIILQATEPVSATDLARALALPIPDIEAALAELGEFYDRTGRGFELRSVAGGWRYYSRAEHADAIAAWVIDGQQSKLSQAALETLAIVAYTQPVARSRVAAIRGVNVDGVVRTLALRDLIAEVGRDPVTGAALFATTTSFLERLGLDSLDDLPPIAPHLPPASQLEAELAHLAESPSGSVDSIAVSESDGSAGSGESGASDGVVVTDGSVESADSSSPEASPEVDSSE